MSGTGSGSGLELDRDVRAAKPRPAETPADTKDWYPEVKPDRRWLGAGLKNLLFAALVLGAVVAAFLVYNGRLPDPFIAAGRAVGKVMQGEAINETVVGVDCFTGAKGEFLSYDDPPGTANIVESPSQVPARFRTKARCIQLK